MSFQCGRGAPTLRRVVIVERDAHQRALLGKELSRRDIAVQGLSDEQVLLDTPGALRHADVIVLGQTRSIASALSLSVRLNDAGIRVPIVNLTGRQPLGRGVARAPTTSVRLFGLTTC